MAPLLYRIQIFPIKALPPIEVLEAEVTECGTLRGDREFAIVDLEGRFVNGKREPRIYLVRARYNLRDRSVALSAPGMDEAVFGLDDEAEGIARWLSRFLGYEVKLVKDPNCGFPDDTKFNGPTLISTETIAEVGSWFGLDMLQMRLRLRMNLEVIGAGAFWEDAVYGKRVRIGPVVLRAANICSRCVVPTRDPFTGVPIPNFQLEVIRRRKPSVAKLYGESDHGYRIGLNTVVEEGRGARIRVMDPVDVLD